MSNSAKKISDLTSATTLASTDKVVVLTNPGTTANVQTITLGNMVNNLTAANIVTLSTTSIISPSGSGANIVIDPDGVADVVFSACTEVFINSSAPTTSPVTGALVVTGGLGVANSVWVNNYVTVGNSSANAVIGWNGNDLSVAEFAGSQNNYVEIAVYNANNGPAASGDFSVNDNLGVNSNNYVDMGINSTGWSNTLWTINGPSDGYLYTGNTNLSIGTANNAYVNFFTNGTLAANERMRITNTGNVGIGTTTPAYKLDVTGDIRLTSSVYANNGVYAQNTFGGTYTHGIVVDYTAGNGRISVGPADGITLYTGGVATTNLMTVNTAGLYIGTTTYTSAANGYTVLPNGMKMNWGWVAANTSVGNATFVSAFTTNAWSVTATSNSTVATYQAAVIGTNNTVVQIRTANVAATNVFYMAIGF